VASTLELYLLALLSGPASPDFTLTDTSSISTGNVTSQTLITAAYPTLPGAPAGTVYELKVPFGGVWGNQLMTIYADIAGTYTSLAVIGAAAGSSGDTIGGTMALAAAVVSGTTCRLSLSGTFADLTVASGHLLSTSTIALASNVLTGVAFTGGNALALAIAFGGSTAGQGINTGGSRLTRYGPA
jgi:hypothetical protein